jgi:hypothetical protein
VCGYRTSARGFQQAHGAVRGERCTDSFCCRFLRPNEFVAWREPCHKTERTGNQLTTPSIPKISRRRFGGLGAAAATAGFDAVRPGVVALAVSRHPQAAAVPSALQARRLYARADRALLDQQDRPRVICRRQSRSDGPRCTRDAGRRPICVCQHPRGHRRAGDCSLYRIDRRSAVSQRDSARRANTRRPLASPRALHGRRGARDR